MCICTHTHSFKNIYVYTGNGAFTIRHERTSKCLQVKNSRIVTADCKETHETLWKWVSRNRLFNLGSKQCLGLNLANLQSPLKMVDCNSQLMLMLWWRCADASVVGASRYKLTLKNEIVVTASINSSDCWRRNNSSDDICQQPYRGKSVVLVWKKCKCFDFCHGFGIY